MTTLFHGSHKKFDIGFHLTPQNDYTSNDNSKELEELFEKHKPDHCISRKDAVFLSLDDDLIDAAGGYTDIIYTVELDSSDFETSDLAWYSEAQTHLENGNLSLAKKCAENYWNGVDFIEPNQSCIECRTESAIIDSIFEINVPEEDLLIIPSNKIEKENKTKKIKNKSFKVKKSL